MPELDQAALWAGLAGGALGAVSLFAFSKGGKKMLADAGFIALAMMVAIYFGARLTYAPIAELITEALLVTAGLGAVRFAMTKWLPAIGVAVFAHGLYDAIIGPHTGVAQWYPPLCAGFDLIVGIGLFVLLQRKSAA